MSESFSISNDQQVGSVDANTVSVSSTVTSKFYNVTDIEGDDDVFNVTTAAGQALTPDTDTTITNYDAPTSLPSWASWNDATGEVTILQDGYYIMIAQAVFTGASVIGNARTVIISNDSGNHRVVNSVPVTTTNGAVQITATSYNIIRKDVALKGEVIASVDANPILAGLTLTIRRIFGTE